MNSEIFLILKQNGGPVINILAYPRLKSFIMMKVTTSDISGNLLIRI